MKVKCKGNLFRRNEKKILVSNGRLDGDFMFGPADGKSIFGGEPDAEAPSPIQKHS